MRHPGWLVLALPALWCGIAPVAAGDGGLAAQRPAPVDPPSRTGSQGRAFLHADHLPGIGCGDCHRPEERHRARQAWTAPDCAACHHGERVVAGCTTCHERAGLAGVRPRPTPLALSVWATPKVRVLPFDHALHPGVGCLDCHRQGMAGSVEPCATCHADHHRPEAECASCHEPPESAVHERGAHLGCGGSGCHAPEPARVSLGSRASCLLCHAEQREHRPERACIQCHALPRSATLAQER